MTKMLLKHSDEAHESVVPVQRGTRVARLSFLPFAASVILITLILTVTTSPAAASPTDAFELSKSEEYTWKSDQDVEEDDADFISVMQKIIAGVVTFVIVVVVVCLVLCFCCPICIFAKMRRRRGVVVRTGPGDTVTRNGNTVTVTVNRSAAPATIPVVSSPQVVAISNNLNAQNKPYPVQESVTVVPLLQPQHHQAQQYPPNPHHQMNIGYPAGPPPGAFPQNFELPPPYPGLPRDSDTANLPYNPYFSAEGDSPSAPPPK